MKKYNIYLIILIVSVFLVFFVVKGRITVNTSNSLHKGVYWLTGIKDSNSIKNGDIVVFDVPNNAKKYIYNRNYQSTSVKTLIKKVAATNEDDLMRIGNQLYINRVTPPNLDLWFLEVDSTGKALPYLSIKELKPKKDEILVLGTNKRSFDSKYFGSIKRSDVKAIGKLIMQF